MALGSSAPEILLSVIDACLMSEVTRKVAIQCSCGVISCCNPQEIMSNEMYIGDLGSGTVVGHSHTS